MAFLSDNKSGLHSCNFTCTRTPIHFSCKIYLKFYDSDWFIFGLRIFVYRKASASSGRRFSCRRRQWRWCRTRSGGSFSIASTSVASLHLQLTLRHFTKLRNSFVKVLMLYCVYLFAARRGPHGGEEFAVWSHRGQLRGALLQRQPRDQRQSLPGVSRIVSSTGLWSSILWVLAVLLKMHSDHTFPWSAPQWNKVSVKSLA